MPAERLNRFLARAGVASRRRADAMIAAGRVRVNGRLPPPSGIEIDAGHDRVTADGRTVQAGGPHRAHHYFACHKPTGVVVSADDPQRRLTVFELVPAEVASGRLFAVGRLDLDSSGLLLLTDDGELAHRLQHPRWKVTKEYLAVVAGTPPERELRRLRSGIELDDGRTQPAEVELLGSAGGLSRMRVVLTEGRNRQVRRMFERIGHPVRSLRRTAFGPVHLGRLREGQVRRLRQPEIAALRRVTGPWRTPA